MSKWFGESWGAPVCDPERHEPTPVGETCAECFEAIRDGDQGILIPYMDVWERGVEKYHLDCWLRLIGTPPRVVDEKRGGQLNWEEELRALLNKNCAENGSGTPDFILSHYMLDCLTAYNAAVNRREAWYGRQQDPQHGMPLTPGETADEQ